MKDFFVAGNWKLQKTHEEVGPFFDEWSKLITSKKSDFAFFGSAMLIPAMAEAAQISAVPFQYGPHHGERQYGIDRHGAGDGNAVSRGQIAR